MRWYKLLFAFLLSLQMLIAVGVSGQIVKAQQGAVLKRGGALRISGALVTNKKSGLSVTSNELGFFSILSAPGDSIEITAQGYTPQTHVVSDYKDALIYLMPSAQLEEVVITGRTKKEELQDIKDSYRSKGVYYGGKPPLLASIFHPLTAINELFGKNAKRARRFNEYANNELEYQEITRRFNDLTIKNAVPIKDDELEDFRSEYLPSVEDIRRWNDYDLVMYIRNSYKIFKESRQQEPK